MKSSRRPTLILHGGAGSITPDRVSPQGVVEFRQELLNALQEGWKLLEEGGSALNAVEAAVRVLEDCPLFNAGRGSVFNQDGRHEMDAAIMDGATRQAGAIAAVEGVRNPVRLARLVLAREDLVLLCGEGARRFALETGQPLESLDYFCTDERRRQLEQAKQQGQIALDHGKFGTVGAVAVDQQGHLAAATSTGGLTNKRLGRVGDSALIGAGTYADDHTCAVSCTGTGETFIRLVLAHDVACRMEYAGRSLTEAVHDALEKLTSAGGEGGLIAVDAAGQFNISFTTLGMYRAWRTAGEPPQAEMFK